MARPTIEDLARAAGTSRSTINRVIGAPEKVRPVTRRRVAEAATEIGFYGLETLLQNSRKDKKPFRLTVLLQQPNTWFCKQLAVSLRAAQDDMGLRREISLKLEHLADLSPEGIAGRMEGLAGRSDAIGVVAAEHPILTGTIERLAMKGTPVYALISTLSTPSLAGFVGLDSRKVGRTAAWAFHRLCGTPRKIGILIGSPRYRSHELAESGFRSYFREFDVAAQLLEPLPTFETDGIAREMTERLLKDHPDMQGLYLCGGGTQGVLGALRESGRNRQIATIAYDLTAETRMALLDGTLDLVISHPFSAIGRDCLDLILSDNESGPNHGRAMHYVNFELYTSENT